MKKHLQKVLDKLDDLDALFEQLPPHLKDADLDDLITVALQCFHAIADLSQELVAGISKP